MEPSGLLRSRPWIRNQNEKKMLADIRSSMGRIRKRPSRLRQAIAIVALSTTLAPALVFAQMDPASIMQAVSIGKQVFALLSPAPDTNQQILAQLQGINGKLDQIKTQLNIVSAALAQLKVHVDRQFDKEAQIEVVSILQYVSDNWQAWTSHPNATTAKAMGEALYQLQTKTLDLMNRQSYASYQVVGYSLYVQKVMMELGKAPASTRAATFRRFVNFFAESVDPGVPESLAQTFAAEKNLMDQLNGRLFAGQQFHCPVGSTYGKCCSPENACQFQDWQAVSGDATTPFKLGGQSGSTQVGVINTPGQCLPPQNRVNFGSRVRWSEDPELPDQAQLPQAGLTSLCPDQLNAYRDEFLRAHSSEVSLDAAIKQATSLRDVADAMQRRYAPGAST